MAQVALDDPAEVFQLPQIREMVSGLLDCAAVGMSILTRNPRAYFDWVPQSHEVERIAKPVATMLARRPQLQNAVKKFASPGMLGGALAAYAAPRLLGLPRADARLNNPGGSTTAGRRQEQHPSPPAERTEPAAATDSTPIGEMQQNAQATTKLPPEQAQRLSVAISSIVDDMRGRMPS